METRIEERGLAAEECECSQGVACGNSDPSWERIVKQIGNRRSSAVQRSSNRRGDAKAGCLNIVVVRVQVVFSEAPAPYQLRRHLIRESDARLDGCPIHIAGAPVGAIYSRKQQIAFDGREFRELG